VGGSLAGRHQTTERRLMGDAPRAKPGGSWRIMPLLKPALPLVLTMESAGQ
jgi:hypothetical protein